MKQETWNIFSFYTYLSDSFFSFRRLVFWFLTLRTGIDLQQLLSQEIVALVIEGDCRLFLSSSRRIFLDSCGLAWLAACPRPTTGGFEGPRQLHSSPSWVVGGVGQVPKERGAGDLPAPACPWQASSVYSSCLRRISETADWKWIKADSRFSLCCQKPASASVFCPTERHCRPSRIGRSSLGSCVLWVHSQTSPVCVL